MVNSLDFGKYLKKLRTERSLTIRQVEVFSGVSNSYLSQLENGKRGIPSPDTLKKLAPVYRISYEELMSAAGYLPAEIKEPSPKYSATVSAYTEAMNILDEIEKELKRYHEKGIPIDRASVQKIVEHRRRILQGEEQWLKYILDAKGIGEAIERIMELNGSLDFDDETLVRYIRKAKEKLDLPVPAATDPAANGPKSPGTGAFDSYRRDPEKE